MMTHPNQTIDYESASLPELVELVRAGHREGYRYIMQRCNQRLFRVARAVLNDESEAEDALQEAYLHAYVRLHSFRQDARVTTWLTRIVLNECYSRLRKRRITVPLDSLEEGTAQVVNFPTRFGMEDPMHKTGRSQTRGLIEDAIETLSEPYRVVFVMRSVEEYSTEETAKMLGIRPETVKTRLHRARRQLRKALQTKLEPFVHEAFPFLGHRCERITGSVMDRLNEMADDFPTEGEH